MTTRRTFVIALGAGLSATLRPISSIAQQRKRTYRVGILGSNPSGATSRSIEAFVQALYGLGYVEGKNLVVERRFTDSLDLLPALAEELGQQKVDVIFAPNTATVQAARNAVRMTPIVFAGVDDPVGSRFVESFARPGGRMTGVAISKDLSGKRLQRLMEAFPKTARVAVFTSGDTAAPYQLAEVKVAAAALKVEILSTQLGPRDDVEQLAAALRKWGAEAIYALQTPTNASNRKLMADFAIRMRLPTMSGDRGYADSGFLMSYGPNSEHLYRRAASYVDRILKGARPGELPVEQPTQFELAINLKTAKEIGAAIPPQLVQRAEVLIR